MEPVPARPVEVEICVEASNREAVRQAVRAAYDGGAARVELCAEMAEDGLTPPPDLISVARASFGDRPGLLVMIRPREGDFTFSAAEIAEMHGQIETASERGADGVVLGVVKDGYVDIRNVTSLAKRARSLNLSLSFHRAFDALIDPSGALEELIELGVDRVLTSGTAWGSRKTVLDGIPMINQLVKQAGTRIEIVLGGGITTKNIRPVLNALPLSEGKVSVHAYSGVRQNGDTQTRLVRELVRQVQG